MRVVYIQYAGDFRATLQRMKRGDKENYYGQDYSVNAVLGLARLTQETTVVCCASTERYEEVRPEGVRTIGAGCWPGAIDVDRLKSICRRLQPTHVVLRFPNRGLLRWLIKKRVEVLPAFADSFNRGGMRRRLGYRVLAGLLNDKRIRFVSNHQVNAARSLERIGVRPSKILPYDWEHKVTPGDYPAKRMPRHKPWQLFYVGQLVESKGIGDLLHAVARLTSMDMRCQLRIAGRGEREHYARLAADLGIADRVEFLGMIAHDEVVDRMHGADVAYVLSHHSYPEGFPMTICEALIARTPLIVSDHPMFAAKLTDKHSALFVPQRSPDRVADATVALMRSGGLYERLSQESLPAWQALQIPMRWADLIERWFRNGPGDAAYLTRHTLAEYAYP